MFKKWRINRIEVKIAKLVGELNIIHDRLHRLDYVDEKIISDLFTKTGKLNELKAKLKILEDKLNN